MVYFNIPGWTAKEFDKTWEDLRAAGAANPNGLLYHVAGQQGNNWVVTDVWESAEQFAKFGETLGPLLAKNNAPKVDPVITPVYFEYTGQPVGTPR